jgi:hypothetical protein
MVQAFPKPKRVKKKYKQKEADRLFSLLIRVRGECEGKGLDAVTCSPKLQCAHIITRGNKRLRTDENNALCLCEGHHRYYTTHAFEWFTIFLPTHFPAKFAYVQRHREEKVSNSVLRLREIIDALDQRLTTLHIEH